MLISWLQVSFTIHRGPQARSYKTLPWERRCAAQFIVAAPNPSLSAGPLLQRWVSPNPQALITVADTDDEMASTIIHRAHIGH